MVPDPLTQGGPVSGEHVIITLDLQAGASGHLGLLGGEVYTEIRGEMSERGFQPLKVAVIGTGYLGLTTGISLACIERRFMCGHRSREDRIATTTEKPDP